MSTATSSAASTTIGAHAACRNLPLWRRHGRTAVRSGEGHERLLFRLPADGRPLGRLPTRHGRGGRRSAHYPGVHTRRQDTPDRALRNMRVHDASGTVEARAWRAARRGLEKLRPEDPGASAGGSPRRRRQLEIPRLNAGHASGKVKRASSFSSSAASSRAQRQSSSGQPRNTRTSRQWSASAGTSSKKSPAAVVGRRSGSPSGAMAETTSARSHTRPRAGGARARM